MRNQWMDVNVNWLDYLEARVEALTAEVNRLNSILNQTEEVELEILRGI